MEQNGAAVSGVYRTRIGAAELGKDYPLTGWRDRRCLGFSVSWGPESESLTSWAGLIETDGEGVLISAMWLLVSGTTLKGKGDTVSTSDSKAWEAFRTQSVVFRRA